MKALWKLTWTELKLALREPMVAFFTLVMPVLLLVIFGGIFGHEPLPFLAGYRQVDLSMPGYISMIIGNIGMVSLPITLASYRQNGILRRLQATPLRPTTVLWSQVAVNVLMAVLGVKLQPTSQGWPAYQALACSAVQRSRLGAAWRGVVVQLVIRANKAISGIGFMIVFIGWATPATFM